MRTVTKYGGNNGRNKPGNRKSWEAALKHLQILIRAAVTEKLKSDGSPNLSNGQRASLGNAWAMLLEKQKQFQMPQSLSNQIQCIQDVTQAISEDAIGRQRRSR